MGIFSEFKDFALKGNMVDMAVGIIIGGATATVVKSLVADVIMPPVGMALGKVDFSKLAVTLQEKTADAEPVMIKYGSFINNIITFLIIAFCVFLIVKAVNSAKAAMEEEKEAEAPAEPPRQEVLLEEIRDALTKKA